MKLFAQEALATIHEIASGANAVAIRAAVNELWPLFVTSGPRRSDGRLDEVWIQPVRDVDEAD
jgi:hypothetical protein